MGTQILMIAGVAVLLLYVSLFTVRQGRKRSYRAKVPSPEALASSMFKARQLPGQSMEFFVHDKKIPASEEVFVCEDIGTLSNRGFKLRFEVVDKNGNVFPDTPETEAMYREYTERLCSVSRNKGLEKRERVLQAAPYAYVVWYYVPAKGDARKRQMPDGVPVPA